SRSGPAEPRFTARKRHATLVGARCDKERSEMANNMPPPKMPPLPGLGGTAQPPKMPPPEVQHAINLASIVTHANGMLAILALEEIVRLREELKLAPLDLKEAAADLEHVPEEFEQKAPPGLVQFEKQARHLAATKIRNMVMDPADN
ncbi:MAG TPA: hypothetical protein VFW47_09065, partial [Phenylobacterium sp.]|nr:hypothetical protein [Phenylobacterium sp.]